MKLDRPVSYKIPEGRHRRLRLKNQTSFHLDLGNDNEEKPWDYWSNDSVVRVDLLLGPVDHPEQRHTVTFSERMPAKLVPTDVFDSRTFVEELNCDIGMMFSMIAAPHSTIELKLAKGKPLGVRVTLTIGQHYQSQVTVPFAQLKPFLKRY
jgi:hypothetical protein